MTETPVKKPRPWWQYALAITGLLLIGCCGLGAILAGQAPNAAVVPTVAATITDDEPPAATVAAEPTTEQTNAPTVAPTEAPTPTSAPEPTALPDPIALSGSGSYADIVTIPYPARITYTHDGARNFAVVAEPTGGGIPDLQVNAIGAYTGIRWLAAGDYALEISADGAWTMDIAPFPPEDAAVLSGTGDYVSGLWQPGDTMPYVFTHDGTRNFAVILQCDGGLGLPDLLVNEIGAGAHEAIVRGSGTCFWEISADGAWTLAPKE